MRFLGFKSRARNGYKKLQYTPFLVLLAREITMHLIMKWQPLSLYCGRYSYRQVIDEGSIESS